MSSKGAAPPAPVGAPAQAARPDTPSGVDARALQRSSRSAVSRSVDLGSFSMRLEMSQPGRNPAATSISPPDPDLDSRSSGHLLVPQPPAAGSPGLTGSSPRMRTVSSRALMLVRTSLPVSHLPQGAEGGAEGPPELCLSQSPKLGAAACPQTPDMTRSAATAQPGVNKPLGRRSASQGSQPLPQISASAPLPAGASPARTPAIASAERHTPPPGAAAAAASPAAASAAESESDPWVALRAHCMAAYGGTLSSDDDGDGDAGIPGPGRLTLLRHPSLVTRSLSRSFGEMTLGAGPAPSAPSPARRHSPSGRDPTTTAVHPTAPTAEEASAVATLLAASGLPAKALGGPAPATRPTAAAASPSAAAATAGGPWITPGRSIPPTAAAATPGAAAPAAARLGAASVSGATPDLSGAALSRARLAAAATMQLQPPPQSPPPPGAATLPLPPFPPPSPYPAPTAVAGLAVGAGAAPHRSESGTSSTASLAAAVMLGMPPRSRQGSGGSGTAGGVGPGSSSPASSLEVQLQPQVFVWPALEPGGGGGGSSSGVVAGSALDGRAAELGGVALAVGSILDVAPLNAFRKRRLSADGLHRHASKYGGGGSSDGPVATAVTTPGGTEGVTVVVDRSAPGGADSGSAGGGSTPTTASPSAGANSGSSPSALLGRPQLITALAFERAPWSQPASSASAASAAAIHANGGSPIAPPAHGAAPAGPGYAGRAKMLRPPHSPVARMPGLPLGTPPARPQLCFLGDGSPANAVGGSGDSIAFATAVDQLRGYKSSKVLLGALLPPSPFNTPPPTLATLVSEAGATTSSPTAVKGVSPPTLRPKLGPFASMRTLRTPQAATAASFLERLSGSSSLMGSTAPSRVSSRRTVAGMAVGECAPEGGRRHSFRRREGSCSLDGSGCDVSRSSTGSSSLQIGPGGGSGARQVGEAPESGRDWSSSAPGGPVAGLHGRRSYKQLLPRGPNGLPLAWSAIEEEDSREGSDGDREEQEGGGGGGGGKDGKDGGGAGVGGRWQHATTDDEGGEGEQDDDDDDDGFNLAAALAGGGWVDLHQTC